MGQARLGGALSDPSSRSFLLSQLNGRVLPVPGLPWLRLEMNTGGNALMLGAHVDVGALLGPVLGFRPSSPSPIGGPPQPQPFVPGVPFQRAAMPGAPGVPAAAALSQAAAEAGPQPVPDIAGRIRQAGASGEPVEDGLRERLESELGADLSGVRLHTGGEADQLARSMDALAFTSGFDIFFRAGAYDPSTNAGLDLLAHETVHTAQQAAGRVAGTPVPGGVSISSPADPFEQEAERTARRVRDTGAPARHGRSRRGGPLPGERRGPGPAAGTPAVQRKGKDGGSNASPGTAATGDISVGGGESTTPSEQTALAKGYALRPDGSYDTPYGRVVGAEQAQAESKVINSAGIFMGAYLARYNAVKKYGLSQDDLDKLSTDAGFTQQFQTGDIVLRLMDASDSAALSKVTSSHYSHSGIVQVKGGRVWVLDSYPGRQVAGVEDSTQLIRFEDFFGDHGTEKIVQGLVLRIEGLKEETRKKIDALIDDYNAKPTSFDFDFKVDNDQAVLYCSELVWRILTEAGSPVLPPNEFEKTKKHVIELIAQLQALIEFQKSQGVDTKKSEDQLAQLRLLMLKFLLAGTPELYSPGSLERTAGLKTIAGFTREGKIEGTFKVTVLDGTVPDYRWDTPDPYVKYSGGLLGASGQTSAKSDTTAPVWNEYLVSLDYESLRSISLQVWDEDVISDDLLATVSGDLRPVNPSGQTFALSGGGVTLRVKVEGETVDVTTPAVRDVPAP